MQANSYVQGFSARFPAGGQQNLPLLNVVGVGTPGCKIRINFTPDIPVQSVRHQLDTGCTLWLYESTSFFAGANAPITCSGEMVYYSGDTRIIVWNTDDRLQPGQHVNCGIICCDYPDLDQTHPPFDQVAGAISIEVDTKVSGKYSEPYIWILLRQSKQIFCCMQDNLTTKPTQLKSLMICQHLKSYIKEISSPIWRQWLIPLQASGE